MLTAKLFFEAFSDPESFGILHPYVTLFVRHLSNYGGHGASASR